MSGGSLDYFYYKLNDRLDNHEDLPPMTVGDFIRLINEEPEVTDEAQNDTV